MEGSNAFANHKPLIQAIRVKLPLLQVIKALTKQDDVPSSQRPCPHGDAATTSLYSFSLWIQKKSRPQAGK